MPSNFAPSSFALSNVARAVYLLNNRKAVRRAGIACGAALLSLSLLPVPLAAETSGQNPVTLTHAYAPGQRVYVEMNVGELNIVRSTNAHQVQLVVQPEFDAGETAVRSWIKRFDVNGMDAHIDLEMEKNSDHGHHGVKVTLYLPSEATLDADLKVGKMTVAGIRGDKDLRVGVGELDIQGLDAHDYGPVSTTAGVGDVEDSVFEGRKSGWLGKSETTQGSGKYRIHASVGVGKVQLMDGKSQETD